jgi:hypothetical protein
MPQRKRVAREEVLAAARELAAVYSESLTLAEFRRQTGWSLSVIYGLFQDWTEIRRAVGLSERAPQGRKRVTRDHLLELGRKLAAEHGEKLTAQMFWRAAGLSERVVADRFGSWGALRELLGLKPRARGRRRYSEAEIFEDLYRVWQYHGTPLFHHHRKLGGRIDSQTIRARFGSWKEAQRAYDLYVKKKQKKGAFNPEFLKILYAPRELSELKMTEEDMAYEKERQARKEREWAEQEQREAAEKAAADGMPQWWLEMDPASQRWWRREAEKIRQKTLAERGEAPRAEVQSGAESLAEAASRPAKTEEQECLKLQTIMQAADSEMLAQEAQTAQSEPPKPETPQPFPTRTTSHQKPPSWPAAERSTAAFQRVLAEGGLGASGEALAEFEAAYAAMSADVESAWERTVEGLGLKLEGEAPSEEEDEGDEASVEGEALIAEAGWVLGWNEWTVPN